MTPNAHSPQKHQLTPSENPKTVRLPAPEGEAVPELIAVLRSSKREIVVVKQPKFDTRTRYTFDTVLESASNTEKPTQ